jgi:hypothetical protein
VQEPNHYHEDHPGTKRAVEPDPPGSLLGGPSIYFAAFLVGDRRVPNPGDVFNMVWNKALEPRPRHIVDQYGDNKEMQVNVLEFPGGVQDDVWKTQQSTRRRSDGALQDDDPAQPSSKNKIPRASWRKETCSSSAASSGSETEGKVGN